MALGRGLGAILDEVGQAYENEAEGFGSNPSGQLRELDIEEISPNPYQPRKYFDEEALVELSESIKRHGLLQPIVVIDKGDDEYLLVAGERRLRAHELAKIDTIKAIIADVDIDDARLRELALIENIQRENLNSIELAHSYDELIKVYSITHEELSSFVHKSRSQITNTLRLLMLSAYVQKKLISAYISQGHAKILVGFDEKEQKKLVDTIMGEKLSVRETELLAKNFKNLRDEPLNTKKNQRLMREYQENFFEKIPFQFKLKNDAIEIKFKNKEEVEKFLSMLKE
jgi:ParB family chromosome partitioning protein